MTQLRASPRTHRLRNLQATIDPATSERLVSIQSAYRSMVGRPVAESIIVRRAVSLLSDHVAALNGISGISAELAALLLVR